MCIRDRGDSDQRIYPWGNEPPNCDYAVMEDPDADPNTEGAGCGTSMTFMVGSKSPLGDSPYGIKDIIGNVWEWVADWSDPHYYDIAPTLNPTGPTSGSFRIGRGGGWINDASYLRTSLREGACLLYTSPSPRDGLLSRMPSSA